MAQRGNKTIPFKVLQGRGTNRKDRHGTEADQVKLEPKLPKYPRIGHKSVLGPDGRKEWKRVTKLLENAKVLTEADRSVLTQYCALWETFIHNPSEFKAAQHSALRMCAVELGFSPCARARLRSE